MTSTKPQTKLHLIPFQGHLLTVFIWLLASFPAYAYEVDTHVKISEQAVNQAAHYNSFVRDFNFDGRSALDQIEFGSLHEDDGRLQFSRSRHHFYDPINGQGLIVHPPFNIVICAFGCLPSLEWGFKYDGIFFGQFRNDFSWTKAREYMYIALTGKNFNGDTVATTADQRNENFQLMFRSVGHVMHLVQDLAVPAHVRNDLHLPVGLAGDLYEKFVLNPKKFNPAWLNGYPTVKLDQFSDFWNSPQGLALFTNHNFISQNTNLDNFNSAGELYYIFPQRDHIVTKTEIVVNQFGIEVPVGVDYGGNIFQDTYTGEAITNDRLTAFSVFDFQAQEILSEHVYSVNDFTMESTANILVRRAVGYSAGLLDYFFRGQLHVALLVPSVDVASLSFGNANDTGRNIDRVAVLLQNKTLLNGQTEPMGPGTLTLTVCYTVGSENCVSADPMQVNEIPSVDSGAFFGALFTLSQPIPTQSVQGLTYYLAFRGQLGSESDAVVGKVLSGPVLHSVIPDEGIEGAMITLAGDRLGSSEVIFNHDLTLPYSVKIQSQSEGSVSLPVPNNVGLVKPGYGGIRVRTILPSGEKVYSNPLAFFPIAQGVVINRDSIPISLRIEPKGPIAGDYAQLPAPVTTRELQRDESERIQLKTGFIYLIGPAEKPIQYIRPTEDDFTIELMRAGIIINTGG